MGRVVLVTGVSHDLGARFARSLASAPGIDKVVGLDVYPPKIDLTGVKYVRADIRTPVVGKVLAVEEVDTVVHLGVGPAGSGPRAPAKEVNVIGTMQLLAACQRAPGVERFVLRSAGSVYGTSARNVAMFTESMPPRGSVSGYPKDLIEVEGYVRGFGRRRPDVSITTLRMAMVISPSVESVLASYFRLPAIPGVLGFDPRMQFLHEDDALEVLRLATTEDRPGTFNVAGPGPMLLSQIARRLSRPLIRIPGPAFGTVTPTIGRVAGIALPGDLRPYFMHGRGLDTTALREIFGYEQRWTTEQTLDEFAASLEPGPFAFVGASHG